jgi:hypothetical protein
MSAKQPAIFSAGLRHLGSRGIGIHVTKAKMDPSLQILEKWPMTQSRSRGSLVIISSLVTGDFAETLKLGEANPFVTG